MEFRINQKLLSSKVSVVQKAVSSKSSMQILEGIHISVKEDILTLRATDLYISIEAKLMCEMLYEGEIVVNSRFFGEIIRKLPDDYVNIKVEDNIMNISCASSEFNLVCQDPYDYPEFPEVMSTVDISLPSDLLKDAIRQTAFAVSQDENRKTLMGVLVRLENDVLNFVALDGYRLALREIPKLSEQNTQFIIPGKSLIELSKVLDDDDSMITLQATNSHLVVENNDTKFFTRLIEGEFFQFEDILTSDFKSFVTVDKMNLVRALERAALLAKEERANLVKFSIVGDRLTIKSNSEIGNVCEELDIKKDGDDLNIAFNSRYILEGIKSVDADEIIISFVGSLNPCILRAVDDNSYTYLVLPVRLAQDEF